jgi:hypothetical protein
MLVNAVALKELLDRLPVVDLVAQVVERLVLSLAIGNHTELRGAGGVEVLEFEGECSHRRSTGMVSREQEGFLITICRYFGCEMTCSMR